MTEEDTFKKLSRTPFKEMRRLYITSSLSNNPENDPIFIDNGWTYEEYCVEFVRILNKDKND